MAIKHLEMETDAGDSIKVLEINDRDRAFYATLNDDAMGYGDGDGDGRFSTLGEAVDRATELLTSENERYASIQAQREREAGEKAAGTWVDPYDWHKTADLPDVPPPPENSAANLEEMILAARLRHRDAGFPRGSHLDYLGDDYDDL